MAAKDKDVLTCNHCKFKTTDEKKAIEHAKKKHGYTGPNTRR